MNFRKAEPSDFDAINALYRLCSEEPMCTWNEFYPTLEEIEKDHASDCLFVLTLDQTIIGTISVVPENELDGLDVWGDTLYPARELARVAVHPMHRGNGYAFRMLEMILGILRDDGVRCVRLLASCDNPPAVKTYEKAGFLSMGTVEAWGSRYYAMEKRL